MNMSYLLFFHILLLTLNCIISDRKTAVILQETFKNEEPIALQPSSFIDLIRESNIFVDKTLLIKDFVEHENQTILVSRPKHWGKSINMDMIKTFLQPRVDEHGRLIPMNESSSNHHLFVLGELNINNVDVYKFTPFLIANHRDIIDQYLGKYHVIYVDFGDLKGKTMATMINGMVKRISESYQQHKYMLEVLEKVRRKENNMMRKAMAEKNYTLFKDFINKGAPLSIPDVRDSLLFLSQTLYRHFQTPVFILMDNYDGPLIGITSTTQKNIEDEEKFIHFYHSFLVTTFIDNSHLKKGLISGTFHLWREAFNTKLKKIHQDYIFCDQLSEFYGFNEWETNTILQHFKASPKIQQQVASHYGGYHYHGFPEQIYNPFSIALFLAKNQFHNWISQDENIKRTSNFVKSFLTHAEFETRFNLANSSSHDLFKLRTVALYFTWKEFSILHKISMTEHTKLNPIIGSYNKVEIADKAVMFLCLHGCFVFRWNTTSRNFYTGSLKFPNLQVGEFMNECWLNKRKIE